MFTNTRQYALTPRELSSKTSHSLQANLPFCRAATTFINRKLNGVIIALFARQKEWRQERHPAMGTTQTSHSLSNPIFTVILRAVKCRIPPFEEVYDRQIVTVYLYNEIATSLSGKTQNPACLYPRITSRQDKKQLLWSLVVNEGYTILNWTRLCISEKTSKDGTITLKPDTLGIVSRVWATPPLTWNHPTKKKNTQHLLICTENWTQSVQDSEIWFGVPAYPYYFQGDRDSVILPMTRDVSESRRAWMGKGY
ncbi:hypothetical protein C8Q75DRAFT_733451 [Abortiporus biennis]|nr:hypothetical protein C8Q75DRAFT_733451 [Abortiporus biennis]